ncbi:restriction endonuclease subunit S [Acinetobacter colistiniresistens]|uniref:restriction endonuclease subunit S n=1 Tax=Acinetobacter colistiniresistens TaxID=280145 RepID=UPI002FE3C185
MSEWQACTLSDVLKFGNGKSRPKESGEIPVYGGNGILDYTNCSNYSDETIVIGRVGAYCGATYYENQEIWVSDNALSAKALYGNDTKFLYYFLKNLDLNQFAQGSSHPLLTQTLLNSIEVGIPSSLPEQKVIASVLSSLDDKIDLLHRQNKTLEAMAETLFRQWFIEEGKEDWEEVQVKEVTTLNRRSVGKNYIHGDILYLDTGSLTKGVVGELQSYSLNEAPSRAKRLVQHNDILISTVRPNQCHYGIVSEPKDNLVVSTGFCTITCETISPYFVYLLLTNTEMTEYLHSIAEGSTSTYPSLKPEDIGAVVFQMPPKELLQQFHNLAESYWQKIHSNHKQIQTLENLRDTLLPKLMSGEVRVQYQTEEVA